MNATRNGAAGAEDAISAMVTALQTPAALSQKLAFETARFWTQRMQAYLDQVELLAQCRSAEQVVTAQAHFIERLQSDYAAETAALTQLWRPPNGEDRPQA